MQGTEQENPAGAKALSGWMKRMKRMCLQKLFFDMLGQQQILLHTLEALRRGQAAEHAAASCLLAVMV